MNPNKLKSLLENLKELDNQLEVKDDDDFDYQIFNTINNLVNSISNEIKTNNLDEIGLKVNVKKLHSSAVIPEYAKDGDAGLDLTATRIINETDTQITYDTELSFEIPKGYVGLVFPRSSIRKYELSLSNSVGVIDSGYRGSIQATFIKTNGKHSVKYNVGDRICQIIIIPYPHVIINEVSELSDSERGHDGFGSTGE